MSKILRDNSWGNSHIESLLHNYISFYLETYRLMHVEMLCVAYKWRLVTNAGTQYYVFKQQ